MEYNFEIEYLPEAQNYIPDALSQRPNYKNPSLPHTVPTTTDSQENNDHVAELMHTSVIQANG